MAEYVKERCLALRREHPGQYGNIACVRTNTQKYLPNFFRKAQLTKLFFLFPARTLPCPSTPVCLPGRSWLPRAMPRRKHALPERTHQYLHLCIMVRQTR